MKTKKPIKNNRKTPISIIFIIGWMVYMVVRILFKSVSINRLNANIDLLGQNLALFNYIADVIILIAFIILIILFIYKKRDSWKYFIILMGILVIGNIIGLFYIDQLTNVIPIADPSLVSFVTIAAYIFSILLMIFYAILAYIVYTKRGYFKN